MSSYNHVCVIGNLGQDPEPRFTEANNTLCLSFSVATSESWKDARGQKQERTDWHNVTVWSKLAETCVKYLKKGSKVLVEGKLRTEEYQKNDEKRYITKIIADKVVFLSPKEKDEVYSTPLDNHNIPF